MPPPPPPPVPASRRLELTRGLVWLTVVAQAVSPGSIAWSD